MLPAGTGEKMLTKAFQFTWFVLSVQDGYFLRRLLKAHFYIVPSHVALLILNQAALKESSASISVAWSMSRCIIEVVIYSKSIYYSVCILVF